MTHERLIDASDHERPRSHERDGRDFDLRPLLRPLWRRKGLLATTVVAITSLAALYAYSLSPVYTASAKVLVGVPQLQVVETDGILNARAMTKDTIENEVQILQSRSLAQEVVRAVELDRFPEFNPALQQEPEEPALRLGDVLPAPVLDRLGVPAEAGVSSVLQIAADRVRDLSGTAAPQAAPAPQLAYAEDESRAVVDRLLAALEVEPEGRSEVLRISVRAHDPGLAAVLANSVADQYLREQVETKLSARGQATDWLTGRLDELREKVEAGESQIEEYRSRLGLIEGNTSTIAGQQLSELNTELATAKAQEARAEARYAKVQELLEQNADAASILEVLESRTIQELRRVEAELGAQRAELVGTFGPQHPRMLELESQVADVRAQIENEVNRILQGLENELEIAQDRTARLEAALAAVEQRIGEMNTAEVRLRAMQRDVDADRTAFEAYLTRFAQTRQREGLDGADARLISAAVAPGAPTSPDIPLIVGVGFVFSLFSGLLLVFGAEQMDRGLRSTEQVRDMLDLPALGIVPNLRSVCSTRLAPHDYVLEKPNSAFGEAIRSLRTSLFLARTAPGRPSGPKQVLLTSSAQGEGKTTLCLSIARHAASCGESVVLVDCDLRRPSVHRALGSDDGLGVVDYLEDAHLRLDDVIQVDEKSGLHFIPAGLVSPNSAELLRSPRLHQLLNGLSARYELVLIDSPPMLPVSDTAILASLAEATLFIVHWRIARREAVETAMSRLRLPRSSFGAVVLNSVDVRKLARYGSAEALPYRDKHYLSYYAR